MGKRPLRECALPGCRALTREKYCEKHKKKEDESRQRRHKLYDEKYRNKEAAKVYNSGRWKKLRIQALAKSYGLCVKCLKKGVMTDATMVHHIKPVREFPELAFDLSNLEGLCDKCHAEEH